MPYVILRDPCRQFSAEDDGKIIKNLQTKSMVHDSISICVLKICDDSICAPLEMIFKQANFTGVFPSEWKKENIVPIRKISDKQKNKNHRPFFLLPICSKTFERFPRN